jgi:hypothetical protein
MNAANYVLQIPSSLDGVVEFDYLRSPRATPPQFELIVCGDSATESVTRAPTGIAATPPDKIVIADYDGRYNIVLCAALTDCLSRSMSHPIHRLL